MAHEHRPRGGRDLENRRSLEQLSVVVPAETRRDAPGRLRLSSGSQPTSAPRWRPAAVIFTLGGREAGDPRD